jgi:hypothetical protein
MPGDGHTIPLALTARISIALDQLKIARAEADPTREWSWGSMVDRMLDVHTKLLQESGRFRLLEEIDPELAERLTPPAPTIRFVPESRGCRRP